MDNFSKQTFHENLGAGQKLWNNLSHESFVGLALIRPTVIIKPNN